MTWVAQGLHPDLGGEASRPIQGTVRRFPSHHPPPTVEAGSCHHPRTVMGQESMYTTQNDSHKEPQC
jgi:hypothetical protein